MTMYRALIITRENPLAAIGTETEVRFIEQNGDPETVDLLWKTISTDGLLRVTLHDVDLAHDEGRGVYYPENIGDHVMILYAALSPRKAEERDRDALVRKAEGEAAKATV